MPPRKVKALKRLCLQSIARDMDSYWCKDYVNNYQGEGKKWLHVVGPFDDLPAGIKLELVVHLAESSQGQRARLKRAHLELLLDESTTQIDFSTPGCAPLLTDNILDLISVRCKNLTVLNIDLCRKVSPKLLLDAFPNFTKLRALKMDGTRCNDRVLHVLGCYCQKLVELHVSHCTEVTDRGIHGFLLDAQGTVQCPDITKLYMEATRVTVEGSKLALVHLPRLQVLQSDQLLEALHDLHEDEFDSTGGKIDDHKKHQLVKIGAQSSIEIRNNEPSEQLNRYVSIAAAVCPNVTDVSLFALVSDECLVTLSLLDKLKSLSLLQCFEHVSFDSGILPFLQIRGENLHTLRLDVAEIDTKLIGYFCPNIRKLDVEYLNNYSSDLKTVKINENTVMFSNLTWLRVACEQVSLDNYSLKLLLSNCQNLTYLLLKNVNDMTDEVLSEIYESNPLDNLETLCLKQCDNITVESMWPLLQRSNNVQVLHLENCQQTTRQDATKIEKLLKQHLRKYKIRVDFEWS